jgi:hypothetical protein
MQLTSWAMAPPPARNPQEEQSQRAARALDERLLALAALLDRVLAKDTAVSLAEGCRALLNALVLLPSEDVALLGSVLNGARLWMLNGEDPDSFYRMTAESAHVGAEGFENIQAYRTIAAVTRARELMTAALTPWDATSRAHLALIYRRDPPSDGDVAGPLRVGAHNVYCTTDRSRLEVRFMRLDPVWRDLSSWLTLPLPKGLPDPGNYITAGRGSLYYAFDQTGTLLYLCGTLYRIAEDGGAERIGGADLRTNPKLVPGLENSIAHATFASSRVQQQLVTLKDGRPLLLLMLVARHPPEAAGQPGAPALMAYVGVDAGTGELRWREDVWSPKLDVLAGCSVDPIESWLFDEAKQRCLYLVRVTEKEEAPASTRPPDSNFQKLFRPSQQSAPQMRDARYLRLEERDAVSGQVLRRVSLREVLPREVNARGECHIELHGEKVYFSLLNNEGQVQEKLGAFDLQTNRFNTTPAPPPAAPGADASLGPCRLHVVRQLLRFTPPTDWRFAGADRNAQLVYR